MNQHYSSLRSGGGAGYSAPAIDILDITTEKGFAQSAFDATDSTENSDYDATSPDL